MNPICESFLSGQRRCIIENMSYRLYCPNNSYDREDLVQVGLLAVVEASIRINDNTPVISVVKFLMIRIRGGIIDFIRHNTSFSRRFGARPQMVPYDEVMAAEPSFSKCVEDKVDVGKAMSILTDKEFDAVLLRYYKDGAITKRQDMKLSNSFYWSLHTAKSRMKAHLSSRPLLRRVS